MKNTTYTKEDFAQLKKYGDNIARDLNQANSRLGGKYAKLERDLVRAIRLIGNPDDPNYITAQSYLEDLHAITAKTKEEFNFPKGGKEVNYKDAQASVDRYERDTEALLDGITEDGTFVALMNATKDIKANNNQNAIMNAGLTVATGEAIMANDNQNAQNLTNKVAQESAFTRDVVRNEHDETRNTMRVEGEKTRKANHVEHVQTRHAIESDGEKTREENHAEHAQTRHKIKSNGERTIAKSQAEADRVIDTLDPVGINRGLKGVRDMAKKAFGLQEE